MCNTKKGSGLFCWNGPKCVSHKRVLTPFSSAFTLLELLIVLFVLVALAAVVVPMVGGVKSEAEETTTRQTLANVRDAVIQYWLDAPKSLPQGNAADLSRTYPQLHFLFVNPASYAGGAYTAAFAFDPAYKVGWRGPYMSEATGTYLIDDQYGKPGDKAIVDAWKNPIVLQNPTFGTVGLQDVRVVSAGPDSQIDINPLTPSSDLNENNVGDDLYVAFTLR